MPETTKKPLGDILVEEGIVSREQLKSAREHQQITGKTTCRTLIDMGFLTDEDRLNILESRFEIETVSLQGKTVNPATLKAIPRSEASRHLLVPINQEGNRLTVAMEEPQNQLVIEYLKTLSGNDIEPKAARSDEILTILDQYPPDDRRLNLQEMSAVGRNAIRALLMLIYIIPLIVFMAVIFVEVEVGPLTALRDFLRGSSTFELGLYLMLSWGAYALIVFGAQGFFIQDTVSKNELTGR